MRTKKDIKTKTKVYSWSAKVDFTLGHGGGIRELKDLLDPSEPQRDKALASLLWDQEYILAIESRGLHPLQAAAGMSGYRLTIEADDTACGAERLGTRLAFALLCVAVDRRWGLALAWPDSPLPCRVIDRTASGGLRGLRAFLTSTSYMDLKDFIPKLEEGFTKHEKVPHRLLLSMELFTSSRLESNNRSKLIMLVSALEALAEQEDLSADIGGLVNELVRLVDEAEIEDETLKASLAGQVKNLTRESARRATKRLVLGQGLTREDGSFIEEAYDARSKILHEGKRVPELAAMVAGLEDLLTRLYRT